MQAGRFVCVALPIILTIGAIISFMIATLSGVAHNNLYLFKVDLKDFELNPDNLSDFLGNLDINLNGISLGKRQVTAGTIGLANSYDITLWGYCANEKDSRKCTSPEFDWAQDRIQDDILSKFSSAIKLPDEIDSALDVFSTVTKYTEIAFIVALAVLGLELFIGIFSNCTRIISCLTWLIGIAAIVLCIAAAGLATAMSAVVVAALKSAAKQYGVKADINTNFLACIWIGTAFAVAASLFWLFTICCCKPERRSRRDRSRDSEDREKLAPTGAYYPITADNDMSGANTSYNNQYNNQQFQPSYGQDYSHAPSYYSGSDNNRGDIAYEPYSHRA
jgi:hypothetical protein